MFHRPSVLPISVSDLRLYQPDVMPTLAEVAGAQAPGDIDGISFLPTLEGREQKDQHEFFFWEYGNQFAARIGDWKAVLNRKAKSWELFDLSKDISEANDVSKANPEMLAKLIAVSEREHTPAKTGSYSDRSKHEADRKAKWGTSPDAPKPKPRKKKTGKVKKKAA